MKVRRFTATSMQKALKTVRDEMGPDAVILSNHRVKGGVEIIVAQNYEPVSAKKAAPIFDSEQDDSHLPSPTFSSQSSKKTITPPKPSSNPWPFLSEDERRDVEDQLKLQDQIEALQKQGAVNHSTEKETQIAGIDSQSELQQALAQMKRNREQGQTQQPLALTPSGLTPPQAQHSSPVANTAEISSKSVESQNHNKQILDDVRSELNDLKELLKSNSLQSAPKDIIDQPPSFVWKKYSPTNSLQAKLWQRFETMGFDDWLNYQLINHLKSHDDEKHAWQSCLQDLAHHIEVSPSDRLKRGGVFALVGPTGAGKTTTIAKMAVRYTLDHEGASVGLVTMDNYRLAAHDQLRTLGQILGVPVQVADQEHTLTHCLQELQDCDLILIDTAGLTPEHPMLQYQLEQLAKLKGRVHTLLTLPATSNSRVLRKVYHNYKAANIAGGVLTKVDEASSLGDAISILLETGLPLSYCTDGQRIPDDIDVASAKGLVREAVHLAQKEQQAAHGIGLAQGAW